MRREILRKLSRKLELKELTLKLKSKNLDSRMRWLQMILKLFSKKKKKLWFNMIVKNLKLKNLGTLLTLKLTEFTDLKTENINWKCLWKREKKKSKFIKISLYQSKKPLRKRDTKLLLSKCLERLESRI